MSKEIIQSSRACFRCVVLILCVGAVFFCCGPDRVCASERNTRDKQSEANNVESDKFSYDVVTVLTSDDNGDALRMPSGLFFDPNADELYVLTAGSKFVVYGPDYFPQESLGRGRGVNTPVDGEFTSDGNIVILQQGLPGQAPFLSILNAAFLPVREISLAKVPELNGFIPSHIAIGKDGAIYLAGLESPRVLILSADGGFAKWMKVPIGQGDDYQALIADDHGVKTAKIRNLAVDSLGNLFLLSEETSKTYVFDSEGVFLFSFGTKGGSEGKLSRPRALAIDEKKRCIYVVDYMRHSVLVYDFAGTFRFEFGGLGWGPGWFNYPVDIVLGPQGQVVVADFFNHRAQVFAVTVPALPERPPALWQGKSL